MYLMIGFILTILSIGEMANKVPYKKKGVILLTICLTLFLALRYGQGTDYYGYYLQYRWVEGTASLLVNSLHHGELGWYMLLVIFNRLGFSYELFIALLSVTMMLLIYRTIKRYSPYGIISLLIFYPTFFLTYCFSAIRQGLVMCLFIGFGLEFLLNRKYLKYYILVFILCFFHKSAIVLAILPIVLKFRKRKPGKWFIFAIIVAVIFGYSGMLNSIASRFGISSDYFSASD